MTRLQWVPLHRWHRGKWLDGLLDCRACRWCGRFEVIAYGDWHQAPRGGFPDAVFAPTIVRGDPA